MKETLILYLLNSQKEIIKQKAQDLNLSISSYLTILVLKAKEEELRTKIKIGTEKKGKKNFLTFRADKEIMEIVKNKASKLSISPTHFLIYLGLEANLEVKSTN